MSILYNLKMKSNIKFLLGLNIKAERVRRNITQEQFAEKIDISTSHISKIEQGITSPSAIVLFKMAKILNIEMEDFFKDINLK